MKKILVGMVLILLVFSLALADNLTNSTQTNESINSTPSSDSSILNETNSTESLLEDVIQEEQLVDLKEKDYEILEFEGKNYKAYPILALIDDVNDKIINDKVNVRSLGDNKELRIMNEKIMIFEDNDEDIFRIDSTEDIYQINDIRKSQEWGYLGEGFGTDTITAEGDLIQIGSHICVEKRKNIFGKDVGKKTIYHSCLEYPAVYKNMSKVAGKNNFVNQVTISIDENIAIITYPLPYDPYSGSVTESNIIEAWYFEENTGTTINGNKSILDLVLANSNQWIAGRNGTGIIVNSSTNKDAIAENNVPASLDAEQLNELMICLDVKFTVLTSTETDALIGLGNDYDFFIDTYPGNPRLRFRADNSSNGNNNANTNDAGFNTGSWYSICGGYNLTHNMLYIDNSLIESSYLSGSRRNTEGESFRLGEGLYNGADMDGVIDNVIFFNISNADVVDYHFTQEYLNADSSISNENNSFLSFGSIIFKPGSIEVTQSYLVNASEGLTSSSFWLCEDSSCTSTCNVEIKGGLIVACN